MEKILFQGIVVVLLSLMVPAVQAVPLEVNSGNFAWTGVGGYEGGGRGQGIYAKDVFTVTSIGLFGYLNAELFDLVVYSSSNGSDTLGVLKTATEFEGSAGNTWNDIAIDFIFEAGNYYVVNWRPSDLGYHDWANTIDYYYDSPLPVTVGPLTLLDGIEGANAENPENLLHPNMRYDINPIPEPAAVFLFGIGLAGLAGARLRKK